MRKYSHKKSGFTLIELLVVISVVAMITTGAVLVLSKNRAIAKDNKRVADLREIAKAIEMFKNDKGHYPGRDASGGLNNEIFGAGECVGDNKNGIPKCGLMSDEFENLLKDYLTYIPADPRHNLSCGTCNIGTDVTEGFLKGKFFYSYDPATLCTDSTWYCALLCFNTAESDKYKCTKNNPECGSDYNFNSNFGQYNADYCIVLDTRKK